MHLDPLLPPIVGVVLVILLTGLVMKRLRQPFVVGCLIAGVILGPHVIGLLKDEHLIGRLGAFGVVLLLFFVGMETSPPALATRWRVAVLGTLLQVSVSVGCVALVGLANDWSLGRILLLGFVISLSSTAVVFRLLTESGETNTEAAQSVTVILISQDVLIVPMLIVLGLVSGATAEPGAGIGQMLGGLAILALVAWMIQKRTLHLPFASLAERDHEIGVFAAITPCLVLAVLTGLLGLSTGLGAFVGGMLLSMTQETRWVSLSLRPFETVFVGLFFVSIGMLLDLGFLAQHAVLLLLIVLLVLVSNTLINGLILRVLGHNWRESLYAGALLAQIGEFSFVLAALGLQVDLIGQFAYQTTIAAITLSIILSPAWVRLFRRLTGVKAIAPEPAHVP
ncbi:MAG: cation:proton antiporter [Planctomycetota bacterium]